MYCVLYVYVLEMKQLEEDSVRIPLSDDEKEHIPNETDILAVYDKFLKHRSSVGLTCTLSVSLSLFLWKETPPRTCTSSGIILLNHQYVYVGTFWVPV